MDGTEKKCCSKTYLISALIVALFTWGFDFFVHGYLFVDWYKDMAGISRPWPEMQQYLPYCIAHTVVVALLVTGGFFCWRSKLTCGAVGSKDCPYRKGMGFGLWLGLIMGTSRAMDYVWLPVAPKMGLLWLFAEIVKWVLTGILLAKLYQCKEKSNA